MSQDDVIRTYRETIRPLYAFVSRRVGGDVSLAEDLVQEVWMRALDTWPARGAPDEPLAWLIRVARNALVSHFRRMRPESVDPSVLDLAAPPAPPGDPETAAVVGWGMTRLRRGHREILEAFYFDQKSVREIASDRSLSERAVEGRLRRARMKLGGVLSRVVGPGEASPGRSRTTEEIAKERVDVRHP